MQAFAASFRSGDLTSEQATRGYLERIQALDKQLGAFEYVAVDEALATARAMDQLREAGTDLGPLMGLPVSVKDLFTVKGMPLTAGSQVDISDIADPQEGPFIRALRQAGCVILGKTKMVEFAYGITGVSQPRGTPWNPCDLEVHRLPGGSSSGAGVAVAAGLCALAIGTDTGGSVRIPAALCGVFGLKTSFGLWPTQGVFPLAPNLDTIGLLTRTAHDAAQAYAELTRLLHGSHQGEILAASLTQVRLGKPTQYFFDGLAPEVERSVASVNDELRNAGVSFAPIPVPQAAEREHYFPLSMPVHLLTTLGEDRFEANKHIMDSVIARRTAAGLNTRAVDLLALEARRQASMMEVASLFGNIDAWISPTVAGVAPPVADLLDPEEGYRQAINMTRNTQPANYLGLCAATLPVPRQAGELPIGYQLMCPSNGESKLLSLAIAIENSWSDRAPGNHTLI
ncbi:amidase [Modicisalibacter luteus]|uniref:amidase n=1 Tax=Modicisalibacter luteus TaxID=453962 RepID=UPI003626A97A